MSYPNPEAERTAEMIYEYQQQEAQEEVEYKCQECMDTGLVPRPIHIVNIRHPEESYWTTDGTEPCPDCQY